MNNEYPIIDDAQTIDGEHSLGNTDSWRAVQKKTSLMLLLESWFNEDEQEQHDTLEALKKALDEDRPAERSSTSDEQSITAVKTREAMTK